MLSSFSRFTSWNDDRERIIVEQKKDDMTKSHARGPLLFRDREATRGTAVFPTSKFLVQTKAIILHTPPK